MEQKICFSVFDDTVGVKVLQRDNLTEEDSHRVSIRMLSGAAATDLMKERGFKDREELEDYIFNIYDKWICKVIYSGNVKI